MASDLTQEGFPYRWIDDAHAPYQERVRLEEHPWLTPWSVRAYRKKHAHGRWRYASALVDHFRGATGLARPVSGLAPPGGRSLRIAAVGDLMWQRTARASYLGPALFAHLAAADLVVLNLETVIDPARPHGQRGLVPRFSSAPEYLRPLAELARRTRVVAQVTNNHCLDHGDAAVRATLGALEAHGIVPTGAALPGGEPAPLVEVAGARVGVASFTSLVNRPWATWRTGLALGRCRGLVRGPRRIAPVRAAVERLRARGAQVVLAGLHWGHEYEFLPDPHQLVVARELAAAGADAVLGHHPHVAQPFELLAVASGRAARVDGVPAPRAAGERHCLAAYSLGNLVSNMVRPDWSLGLVTDLVFRLDGPGPAALDGYAVRPLLVDALVGERGFGVDLLEHARERDPAAALPAAVHRWWRGLSDLSILDGDEGRRLQGTRSQWSALVRTGAHRAAGTGAPHREPTHG